MAKINGRCDATSLPGVSAAEPAVHEANNASRSSAQEPSQTPHPSRPGGQHRCEGRKESGKPCGMINTLRTIEGGWRCRHHRDGLAIVGAEPVDTPPSTKFRSKQDAEKYTSWVLAMGARGRLNAAQINALLKAVSLWNKIQERAEKDVREAMDALLERVKSEVRQLVKARAAYEDGEGDRGEALVEEVKELRQEIKADLRALMAKQGGAEERYHGAASRD